MVIFHLCICIVALLSELTFSTENKLHHWQAHLKTCGQVLLIYYTLQTATSTSACVPGTD
jgi:hypothetical protein